MRKQKHTEIAVFKSFLKWIRKSGNVDAMHVFTKILKSAFALLMLFACGVCWWHLSPRWTSFECMNNLDNAVALLQALVFTIHSDKSQLITTQKMTLLAFVIDSTMTLKLTEIELAKIFTLCEDVII